VVYGAEDQPQKDMHLCGSHQLRVKVGPTALDTFQIQYSLHDMSQNHWMVWVGRDL